MSRRDWALCALALFVVCEACSDDAPVAPRDESAGAAGRVAVAGAASVAGSAPAAAGKANVTAGSTGSDEAGAGAGGSAGDDSSDSAGAAGAIEEATDTPPWRPLNVTAAKMRFSHTFKAKTADAAVSFNDANEVAAVDPRSKKMIGKLVLPLGGAGSTAGTLGNEGAFLLPRGYHVLGIAVFEDYDILQCDADFFGDARKEAFDGLPHTKKYDFAKIEMGPADGLAQRTQKALAYLAKTYPAEDWGYFLNRDGTVRWSDVIFTGVSHGASSAARFAMLVRASRAVSFAGPRDNSSGAAAGTDAACPTLVTAKWFSETPLTPIDRFYAVTGAKDAQHPQHLYAMDQLGYVGKPVDMSIGAPWDGSHRITAPGGHESPCNETTYQALCNYLFGVDPANAKGLQ